MKPSEQQGNLNMGQQAPQPQAAPEQPAPQVPVVTPTAPQLFPSNLAVWKNALYLQRKRF